MNYISCDGCGVVVNFDSYALEKEKFYNHDQDSYCQVVKCPVCKELIPNEEWVKEKP